MSPHKAFLFQEGFFLSAPEKLPAKRVNNMEPFYKDGLCFTCQRCSSCCRFDPGFVNLSETDLEKLLKWSNLDRESFIAAWCRWVPKA